jgi:3-deoxy-D-manno-octulosonate 8-phosphate phosphatase KdsC-like HAD superfamily phosphatase
MRPEITPASTTDELSWREATAELRATRNALTKASPGIARQGRFDEYLAAQDACTLLVHGWFARTLGLEQVVNPRVVLSLDVDGVLEDESQGFSCSGLSGSAALRLLQLGRVAVLLNTARSLPAVRDRAEQFKLLGGIAAFGAGLWDNVFGRDYSLVSDRGREQLAALRSTLTSDPNVVQDRRFTHSIRVSRLIDGEPVAISGTMARRLLDSHGLTDLSFWVAPHYTDFVDRSIDKGIGLKKLQGELGLSALPVAAMGDGVCDVPMLRAAAIAFVPAATLPSYVVPRHQQLVRSRYLGENSLWDAACRLVPTSATQRTVIELIASLKFPAWLPPAICQAPTTTAGLIRRFAAGLASR